jgi:transcriptional regulator GlxA family with amidase domain
MSIIREERSMKIAVLLYDRFTALDAVGPYEVLSRLPGATLTFVAVEPGSYRTDTGSLALVADASLADMPHPEIVVVPGGPGSDAAGEDPRILDWLRAAHETSTWTASVCTGSLILAAAGFLDGLDATTHWRRYDRLAELGAKPTSERVVRQGKIITAAGVSAGIDMALFLARIVAGDDVAQAIQLGIEYDPQPPFDSGSPEKAPARIVEYLRSQL